jgi:predicted dienelactone hydrolase
MRLFEILIVLTVFLTLVGNLFAPATKLPRFRSYLPGLATLFIFIHLVLERYRWQMLPLYALAFLLLIIGLLRLKRQASVGPTEFPSRTRRLLVGAIAVLGLLVLAVATWVLIQFPVLRLPQPTGLHAVGTTFVHFSDSERPETLTDDLSDIRSFTARVWYPAELPARAKPMAYQEHSPRVGSISPGGPPDFAFSHLGLSKSNSHLEAPVSDAETSYPVLMFSDGFLADFDDYQLLVEELASHGYIIFSLNNPYESQSVVQPDGSVVPFTEEHRAGLAQHMQAILPLWERFWTSDDVNARNQIAKEILHSESFMDNVLNIRVADMSFAVDELERMNEGEVESVLAGRMDLSRLGIIGHSMGGAVAGQVCLVDERFKAGVNLDGFQWGDVVEGEITQPFMIMYSEMFAGANDYILNRFASSLYLVTLNGSTHMNFEDAPLMLPITRIMGMAGSIAPTRMKQIVNDYLLAFFDRHLSGAAAPLLDGASPPYPEVEFERLERGAGSRTRDESE